MSIPVTPENATQFLEWLGWGLFIASEGVGMSPLRENYVLELVLHMAQELFPYELKRREPPTRANRPRRRRDSRGRFTD
jgi:hypothetical protein